MSYAIQFAIGAVCVLVIFRVLMPRWPLPTTAAIVVSILFSLVYDLIRRRWGWSGLDVIFLAYWTFQLRRHWRNRKRRRWAQKLGYKALALRAKLVRTMKDLRQPRRVLRPSPMPV